MISLTRGEAAPDVLRKESLSRQRAEKTIRDKIEAGQAPLEGDFSPLWRKPAVKQQLATMQNCRCCYCERLRDATYESDVDHFRPKTEVSDKNPSKPGYWWLAYDWNNLLFTCKICNEKHKKTKFPIRGTRATGPNDSLDEEDALLIDPANDDVEGAIGFDPVPSARVVFLHGVGAQRKRGDTTVKVLHLNRPELLTARGDQHEMLATIAQDMKKAQGVDGSEDILRRYRAHIRSLTSSKRVAPYVGMARALFRTAGLGEFVAND